jgi:hypothetical protein
MRSKYTVMLFALAFACAIAAPALASERDGGAPAGRAPSGVIVGPYDCCLANGSPGCSDATCEATVCAADSFCCTVEWDGICAGEAFTLCTLCSEASSCCVPSGGGGGGGAPTGTGCDDPTCEADVCAIDPFCCDTSWDTICVTEAWTICGVCGAYIPPIIQEIPTLSKTGLGLLAAGMLLGGALLLRRRRSV